MKNILYIIILGICLSKNFIYSENSWYSILSPKQITSISYTQNEVFFSSINGLFVYNKDNKDFFYSDYMLNNLDNKNIYLVHYDTYRDNIWVLNKHDLLFKSNLSNIWTKINFYDFSITPRSIKNIGSNPNYIIIKTLSNEYIFLPYDNVSENNIKYICSILNNLKI